MVNFKFVTIGDPHFKLDNLSEVNDFIAQTEIELQQIENLDFIVCLGDLLHTHARINSMPMNEAYKFIEMLSKYALTYVLVGNHDMINNSQFLTTEHWMNGMKKWNNVIIVDSGYVNQEFNCSFVPFVPPGRFEEALETFDKDWRKRQFIFAHQEFKGCKMGAIVSEVGDEWKEEYPYVISGHIHDKQKPQCNIFYVGSAMQHAFGESPKKGLHLFDCMSEKWEEIEIRMNIVERKILYVNSKNILDEIQNLEKRGDINLLNEKMIYKITVRGNIAEYKMFQKSNEYKQMLEKGVKFVYKHEKNNTNSSNKVQVMCFKETLLSLIKKENNSKLYDLTVSLLI